MRWIKRLLIIIPALVILLIGGVMLINALTPRPISLLTRQQFDTSKKHQVYPRPKKFKQKTAGRILPTSILKKRSPFVTYQLSATLKIGRRRLF